MSSQKLLPLVLSAKASLTRMFDAEAESADSDFRHVRPKVLEQDNNTCRFCGFKDKGLYIQVHHKDDDHHNNRIDNLVTACIHCHACHHIGLWGLRGEAVIIHLPEIEQWKLSHLCRTILVAQHFPIKLKQMKGEIPPDRLNSAKRMEDAAKGLMARLEARAEAAVDLIGTSSPQDLANVLHQLPPELYEKRATLLKGLRLLIKGQHRPKDGDLDILQGISLGWMERLKDKNGPYTGLLPPDWINLAALSGGAA